MNAIGGGEQPSTHGKCARCKGKGQHRAGGGSEGGEQRVAELDEGKAGEADPGERDRMVRVPHMQTWQHFAEVGSEGVEQRFSGSERRHGRSGCG